MQTGSEGFGISGSRPKFNSVIRLVTCAASSTNTLIRTWTTVTENSGSDMIYIKDAVLGDMIKIRVAGTYYFELTDSLTAQVRLSVTINQNPTTAIGSIPDANIICMNWADPNGNGFTCGAYTCNPGDVIRCHMEESNEGGNAQTHRFKAIRIA